MRIRIGVPGPNNFQMPNTLLIIENIKHTNNQNKIMSCCRKRVKAAQRLKGSNSEKLSKLKKNHISMRIRIGFSGPNNFQMDLLIHMVRKANHLHTLIFIEKVMTMNLLYCILNVFFFRNGEKTLLITKARSAEQSVIWR